MISSSLQKEMKQKLDRISLDTIDSESSENTVS